MTEYLDLNANITAILQLATQVTQLSYSYACGVQNAPKTQCQYLQEVSKALELLLQVEKAVADAEYSGSLPAISFSLNGSFLRDCSEQFSALQIELQKRKLRFLGPFQDKELQPHIDMLRKYRSLFADFVTSCAPLPVNQEDEKPVFLSEDQYRKILLASIPSTNITQQQRPSVPCPGTGKWFLNSESVRDWIDVSSSLLWCYGPAGVGKSFLSSTTLGHLLGNRDQQESTVLYYSCDFSSQGRHQTLEILHDLLRQLIEQGSKYMLAAMEESYKEPSLLRNSARVAQLISKAGSVQQAYLIIDSIDFVKDVDQVSSHMLALSASGIRVLITSQDLPHIRIKMNMASHFEIMAHDDDLKVYVNFRLQESTLAEYATDESLVDDILSRTGNLYETHRSWNAYGDKYKFILVRLFLDQIQYFSTINQVHKALERSPQGLQQAFEISLMQMDAQSEADAVLARRLIAWIVYAKRRLTLDEALCAFALRDKDTQHHYNIQSSDLLRVCAGMVLVDKVDNTLGLVHDSAYEFFRTKFSETDSNIDIARTCLQSVCSNVLGSCKSSTGLTEGLNSLSFLDYSAKHWGHHLSGEDSERQLEPIIMRFLGDGELRNRAFEALQLFQGDVEKNLAKGIFNALPTGQSELHIAAYWNLSYIAKGLLKAGANISAVDSYKHTPLHWACANNHLAVAEVLQSNGADVNSQDIQGWTPLFWAAFLGNLDLVCCLLKEANHLIPTALGWTALHWAISGGHSKIVQELLDHNSRSRPSISETMIRGMDIEGIEAVLPVQLAADAQDEEIFALLVQHLEPPRERMADSRFNMIWNKGSFDEPVFGNIWKVASKEERHNGRESRLNTEYTTDPERSDPQRWKSVLLLLAIRDQQLSSVKMLIKIVADANYQDALYAASSREDPRYMQCLLANGADPNGTVRLGRTVLHEAVMNGFMRVASVLIEAGADVNQPISRKYSSNELFLNRIYVDYCCVITPGQMGATPLMQACGFLYFRRGQPGLALKVAEFLLSKGADPRLQDEHGRTALHYAVFRPFLPLIKLLAEAGSVVDVLDHDGHSPLYYLGMCEEKGLEIQDLQEIVRLLIGSQDGLVKIPEDAGDPMTIALQSKRWKIVGILLDHGVSLPTDLALDPILSNAIQALEAGLVSVLLRLGACPSSNAVATLVNSVAAQWTDKPSRPDLYARFRCILSNIVPKGANVNACPVEADSDSHSTDSNLEEGQLQEAPLGIAAKLPGSRDILRDLLDCGADLFPPSSRPFDPVLIAAAFGESEDLTYLLDQAATSPQKHHWSSILESVSVGIDPLSRVCLCLQKASAVDCVDEDGHTLLHLAAANGNTTLISSLISSNARLEIVDSDGRLPVHSPGIAKQIPALQILLPRTINALSSETPPLSPEQRRSIIGSILERKGKSKNILDIAIDDNNLIVIELLLQHGMDPDSWKAKRPQCTPALCHAARHGRSDLFSLLLRFGANVEASDDRGWRSLHEACYRGHTDIVTTLIQAGADVHATTVQWNDSGMKPTGLYDWDSWTGQPLHLAAMGGHADIVKLLLWQGVGVHADTGVEYTSYSCPGHGPTALHLALDTGTFYGRQGGMLDEARLEIAQLLVGRGAMVYGVVRRFSPKHVLKFRCFPGLWDALVAGDLESGNDGMLRP